MFLFSIFCCSSSLFDCLTYFKIVPIQPTRSIFSDGFSGQNLSFSHCNNLFVRMLISNIFWYFKFKIVLGMQMCKRFPTILNWRYFFSVFHAITKINCCCFDSFAFIWFSLKMKSIAPLIEAQTLFGWSISLWETHDSTISNTIFLFLQSIFRLSEFKSPYTRISTFHQTFGENI